MISDVCRGHYSIASLQFRLNNDQGGSRYIKQTYEWKMSYMFESKTTKLLKQNRITKHIQ